MIATCGAGRRADKKPVLKSARSTAVDDAMHTIAPTESAVT
jgi:hypothetical protein